MEQLENIIHKPNWKIILSDIVKESGFDIWNIDLLTLTDVYLSKIKQMKEENLIVPANALLAAAILLKLKAYTLKLTSLEDDDDELKIPTEDQLLGESLNLDNPIRLKKGQVSLDELVDVVDYIMNKPTKSNIKRKVQESKEEDFVLPKKNEAISVRIDQVLTILKKEVDKEGCITFSKLVSKNPNDSFNLINNYFIPLLFLSQDQKINLWQDNFFSDIFIKILN